MEVARATSYLPITYPTNLEVGVVGYLPLVAGRADCGVQPNQLHFAKHWLNRRDLLRVALAFYQM